MKNKKVTAIISGGLDSSTMLWYLHSEGYEIAELLTFNYGQRHDNETENAKKIVNQFNKDNYSVNHKIVDISSIKELIAKGSITGDDSTPHDMYDSENQRVTVVPNRNMIFLSIAAGRAVTLGASFVGYAAHASDHAVYPDCRPEFIEALDKALYLGNLWDPVNLIAPFKDKTKAEIVKLAVELKVPLHLTWSCYEGGDEPCLNCGTCLERTEAFLQNNMPDPAISDELWIDAVKFYDNKKSKNGKSKNE